MLLLLGCWVATNHAAAHVRSMDPVIGPAFRGPRQIAGHPQAGRNHRRLGRDRLSRERGLPKARRGLRDDRAQCARRQTRSNQLPAANGARKARRLAQGRSVGSDCARASARRRNCRWPEVVDGTTMEAAYARRGLDRGGRTWIQTLRSKPVPTAARNCEAGSSWRRECRRGSGAPIMRKARLAWRVCGRWIRLAAAAVESGLGRSPTFTALVQAIEGSQFVVYVETSRKLPGGMDGCLVHGGAAPRYLRVLLKIGLSVDERIEVTRPRTAACARSHRCGDSQ